MKAKSALRIGIVAGLGLALAAPAAAAGGAADVFARKFAPGVETIEAWYVYTGKDDEAHITTIRFPATKLPFFGGEDALFKVRVGVPTGPAYSFMADQTAIIRIYNAPPNLKLPKHVAPTSEMFLILRGTSAFVGHDGKRVMFGPGDIVIFEDMTGKGHAGEIGPEGFTAINFEFPKDKPISALADTSSVRK